MTVKEFKEFCCSSNIVLKDSYNGRTYTKIDNYLDKEVTGFYPKFDVSGNNSYGAYCGLQIVAWIPHDFSKEERNEK